MALSIAQATPIDKKITPADVPVNNLKKPKIDLCPTFGFGSMSNGSGLSDFLPDINLGLPSLEFPNIDLPKFKLFNSLDFNKDIFPSFSLDILDSLKLKGMENPFKCSLASSINPSLGSLDFKTNFDKMGNVNCTDVTSGIDNPTIQGKVLKTALNIDNCSKTAVKAVDDLSNDLDKLGILDSFTDNPLAKFIIGSVVDNKLDIGKASSLLTGDDTILKVTEAIGQSGTPLDKIMQVGKATKVMDNKDDVVKYASKVVDKKTLARLGGNGLLNLGSDGAKDSNKSKTTVAKSSEPKTTTASQDLTLMSKAGQLTDTKTFNNLGGSGGFLNLGSMVA